MREDSQIRSDATPPRRGEVHFDDVRTWESHHDDDRSEEPDVPEASLPAGLSGVHTLRERARKNIGQGAVTGGYRADRKIVLRLLNDAMATEIVCFLRYKRHYYMAEGISAQSVAAEFLEHALEEQAHADVLAQRIVQLGGEPDLDPDHLSANSHAQYVAGTTLAEMIRENLVAERIAIDSYGEVIRYLGDDDPTTRRILEDILAAEEEHADDLITLLRGQPA